MEYIIASIKNNKRTVLSRHADKEDAFRAGEAAWEQAEKGTMIECISGNVSDDGTITGAYLFYEAWQ